MIVIYSLLRSVNKFIIVLPSQSKFGAWFSLCFLCHKAMQKAEDCNLQLFVLHTLLAFCQAACAWGVLVHLDATSLSRGTSGKLYIGRPELAGWLEILNWLLLWQRVWPPAVPPTLTPTRKMPIAAMTIGFQARRWSIFWMFAFVGCLIWEGWVGGGGSGSTVNYVAWGCLTDRTVDFESLPVLDRFW